MKSVPSSAMWSTLVLMLSLPSFAIAGPAGSGAPPASPPAAAPATPATPATAVAAPSGADSTGGRATLPKGQALLQIDGPAGARIRIDGKDVAELPMGAPLALAPGSYFVQGELRGFAPYDEELRFDNAGERRWLQMRLIPLHRRDAVLYSLLLAGLGENYVGRPVLGYVLSAAEVGGIVAGIGGQLLYTNHRSDYLIFYDAYQHAVSEDDVAAQRAAAQDAWNKMRDAESLRNTGLLVAAGAIVVGALDVWLRFPSVEVGPGPMAPPQELGRAGGAGPLSTADPLSAHVAWNVRF